jgi:hypothetical protein
MSTVMGGELLELARLVLERAGYATESIDLAMPQGDVDSVDGSEGARMLLAQNRFFVLLVGAAATLEQLQRLEPLASTELTRRTSSSELGAKQWDVYLVLLGSQELPDDGRTASELAAINYNTRFFRRIAQPGVRPDLESVSRALSPFLPLPTTRDPEVLEDALALLERELPAYGVTPTLAGRAIAAFRETGSLSSV